MTISPMQLDYVTKEEFGEFRDEMTEFKDENKTEHVELREYMKDGFEKMEEFMDNKFVEFGDEFDKKLDTKFANNNRVIISQLNKKMDENLEKTKIDIIAAINSNK